MKNTLLAKPVFFIPLTSAGQPFEIEKRKAGLINYFQQDTNMVNRLNKLASDKKLSIEPFGPIVPGSIKKSIIIKTDGGELKLPTKERNGPGL